MLNEKHGKNRRGGGADLVFYCTRRIKKQREEEGREERRERREKRGEKSG